MKKVKLGLLVAAMVGAMFAFTGCGAKSVDLNDYVNVEFDGYDGYGNAKANLDFGKLEEDMGFMAIDDATDFDIIGIEMIADGDLDKTTGLSNGDTVKYVWNISDESAKNMKKKTGIKLKYKDLSKKVEGLKDPKDFNVADVLEISVSGVAPQGQIIVTPKIADITVEVDKKNNLKNGDEVNITVKPMYMDKTLEEVCLADNVPVFEPNYKYTVEGLAQYVQDPSNIPDTVLEVMKKQGEKNMSEIQKPDCDCNGSWLDPLNIHMNFDSYKLVGVGVVDAGEESTGNSFLIYELHYSVHGDVTTYYAVGFNWIQDSDAGLKESDINGYDHFSDCSINDKIYGGSASLEELKENLKGHSSEGNLIVRAL